ncbi:MAG: hypothetical protein Q9157_000765 [Trypethelium eluteriae]
MDPLSAVLAFTGLGASLITLVDAISEVSTKLLEVRRKFKDAPRSILELNDDLEKLRALSIAIQARFSRDEAAEDPHTLRIICESFIERLEKELRELHMVVNRSSAKSTLTVGVGFKAKVQHVLAESTVQEFRGRIGTYIMYLDMVHTLLNTYVAVQSSNQNSNRRLGFVKRHPKEKKRDFNLGLVSVKAFEVQSANRTTSSQGRNTKRLKLAFLAPPWLSRTALLVNIDQSSQSFLMGMRPRVTLQPISVNHSPKLLEALHRLDLLQLKQLFETNRARPNDMVMDIRMNEPVTLFEVSLLPLKSVVVLVTEFLGIAGYFCGVRTV